MVEHKGGCLSLRDAVRRHAADPRAAREWIALNIQRELRGIGDGAELHRWIKLDIEFAKQWMSKLFLGEFVAEGFRSGEVAPTRLPKEWWHGCVDLDLWKCEAKWNDVHLRGLTVYPASHALAFDNAQRTPAAVREWMRERVKTWPDGEPKPSEKMDWIEGKARFGADFTRDELRIVRLDRTITPTDWRKPGRRKRR